MRALRLARTAVLFAAASLFAAPQGFAQNSDINLPSSMTWTCWSQGSGAYNQAIAIGTTLKNELNVSLQVISAQTDLARQLPLKDGRVDFSCSGSGAYLSQEGLAEFANPEWGPQSVRLFALNVAPFHAAIVVGADSGVKQLSDLKGKRVAYVLGTPSLNLLVEAHLAFANLTWDDVQKVEVAGFQAAVDAIIDGRVDAILLSSATSQAAQLESSSRGGYYPPIPHEDTEGWARLKAVAAYVVPIRATFGAMIPEEGLDGAASPLPFWITYDHSDAGLVYNMTKALFDLHDDYAPMFSPGTDGLGLDQQIFDYIVPYHEGAIRYFKEKGVWTDELQAHNDSLIERQAVLKAAWDKLLAENPSADNLEASWLEARRAALTGAGLEK